MDSNMNGTDFCIHRDDFDIVLSAKASFFWIVRAFSGLSLASSFPGPYRKEAKAKAVIANPPKNALRSLATIRSMMERSNAYFSLIIDGLAS